MNDTPGNTWLKVIECEGIQWDQESVIPRVQLDGVVIDGYIDSIEPRHDLIWDIEIRRDVLHVVVIIERFHHL